MVKVDGTDDIVNLIPAPGTVYEEGTFRNKANDLSDAVAAMFGLGADAVQNDVFGVLSRFQSGLGNEYVWEKTIYTARADSVDSSGQTLNAPNGSATAQHTVTFYNNATFENGNIVLSDSFASYNFTYNNFTSVITTAVLSAAVGKFFYGYDGSVWSVDSSTYAQQGGNNTCYMRSVAKVVAIGTVVGYVNSPNSNAYPPAVSDGYTYTALGQLGAKVQITTGSYVGTGTYGSSNPNSLTFGFEPKLLILDGLHIYPWTDSVYMVGTSGDYINYITRNGTTISWYNEKAAYNQCNHSGQVYNYLAIG